MQDQKIKLDKGSKSKDFVVKSLNQHFTKDNDNVFLYAQKTTMKIDPSIQSKQLQSNKKLILANETSRHLMSTRGQFKPYSKEMLFSHTINNYSTETPRSRWRKIPSLVGIDDQLENSLKTNYKVSPPSPNEKNIFNISLNVHSSKKTYLKESYAHDIYESYGSYSTPSPPFNHNHVLYHRSKELSNSYHETLSEPVSSTKSHINYNVTNGGHVVDAQLNHEDNLPQYKWKGTRQLFYDYEKKKSKKYGIEREQIISTIPLQKWVPLDKNAILKNDTNKIVNMKSIVSQNDKVNTNNFCFNENKGKEADIELNNNVGNCNSNNIRIDSIINNDKSNIIIKDLETDYLAASNGQHLPTLKPIHHLYSTFIIEDSKIKNQTMEPNLSPHIDKGIINKQNIISINEALHLSSQNILCYDNSQNFEVLVHLNEESSHIFEQCNEIMSFKEKNPCIIHDCKSKIETTDATIQHLIGVISNTIHDSLEARKASQNFATYTGTPLAEIERLLVAVAPKFNPIPSLRIPNSWLSSKKICNCKSNVCGFNKKELCSCHLIVPLSSIWQWYEKPSNYGLEVQALDFLYTESKTSTYFAYFLPFLSAIQIYGYKNLPSHIDNGCSGWNILDPYVDALKKTNKNTKKTYALSAQLLFEFFDSDPPSQRQPLFQK